MYQNKRLRVVCNVFPIDDILSRSGNICDQVAKLSEIAPKVDVFAAKFLEDIFPRVGCISNLSDSYSLWVQCVNARDIITGQNSGPIFTVCGPKFTG